MISAIIILVSLLLIGVVIIQNSKGGGLDSSFSSQQNLMGVKKSTEVVEKATWTLVGLLVILCIISTKMNTGNTVVQDKSSATEAAKQEQQVTPNIAPPSESEGGDVMPSLPNQSND